jgi:hypothetical protein
MNMHDIGPQAPQSPGRRRTEGRRRVPAKFGHTHDGDAFESFLDRPPRSAWNQHNDIHVLREPRAQQPHMLLDAARYRRVVVLENVNDSHAVD